jgi:hypothetical protein
VNTSTYRPCPSIHPCIHSFNIQKHACINLHTDVSRGKHFVCVCVCVCVCKSLCIRPHPDTLSKRRGWSSSLTDKALSAHAVFAQSVSFKCHRHMHSPSLSLALYTHTHTHTHARALTYANTETHMPCACTHTHTPPHTQTQTHTKTNRISLSRARLKTKQRTHICGRMAFTQLLILQQASALVDRDLPF